MARLGRMSTKAKFHFKNRTNHLSSTIVYRWALGPAKNNLSARNPNKSRKARRKAKR